MGLVKFEANCSGCHGINGRGSAAGPPFMYKIYAPSRFADQNFYRAAKNGVRSHNWSFGNMRPVPWVKEADVTQTISYIREL